MALATIPFRLNSEITIVIVRMLRITSSESRSLMSHTSTCLPPLMNGTLFSFSAWRVSLTPMKPSTAAKPYFR